MIHLCGDYYFDSDGVRNFTLHKKGTVGNKPVNGKQPKEENIGKTTYETLGYYSTLDSLLQGLVRKASLEIASIPGVKSIQDVSDRLSALVDQLSFALIVDGQEKPITPKRVKKTMQS